MTVPLALGEPHRLLLLIDHNQPRAELIADTLLNQVIDNVGRSGVSIMELADVPGQIVARKVALQAGFAPHEMGGALYKTSLATPITPSSFPKLVDQLRLLFGNRFIGQLPENFEGFDELLRSNVEEFTKFEKVFAPTLIVSNDRRVCIQPIAETFANELLGTSDQLSLLDQFEGAFRSQKIYVSSGRSRNLFRANQLILFYESSRTGGRGAIVATARVDNVVTQKKNETRDSDMKRTVLDSVDRFSASGEVTLTGFSSLLRFPTPVSLDVLKRLSATGTQNLQTTTMIDTATAQQIFDLGWADES